MQQSIPWSSSVSLFAVEMMAIIYSMKCTVPFSFAVLLLSLVVTHCHSLSLFVTRCHSVTRCTTRCHSLSHSMSLVVIHCHSMPFVIPLVDSRYHSLSLVVPLVVTRCHSFSFVVTWCTICLSFYKQSSEQILHDENKMILRKINCIMQAHFCRINPYRINF